MTEMLIEPRHSEPDVRRATARRLAQLHTLDSGDANSHCWWCLKAWPCPDSVWSARVLEGRGFPQAS